MWDKPHMRYARLGLRVLFACAAAASCIGMLMAWSAGNRELGRILRLVACVSPVLLALACGAAASWYGRWIALGLLYCWFGDRLLGSHGIVRGLLAFLLGHIAFAAASLVRGIAFKPFAIACAALLPPAGAVLLWLHEGVPRHHMAPVVAYLTVISLMVAFAVGASWRHKAPLLVIAAVTFYVSDLFVARSMFVQRDALNSMVGLPLYFGSLVLFALSIPGAGKDAANEGPPRMVEWVH